MLLIETAVITEMKEHINACKKSVDELSKNYHSPEKVNNLLDSAMLQIELACLDMRRLCEMVRPKISVPQRAHSKYHSKTIYGEITLTENGWVHIKLNTLLPHYKIIGGTQYISDSIVRMITQFENDGGELPCFDKAFLAIIEHCDYRSCEAFDHDNKGFKAVQNALKGRLFPDDDQFELSLGLFTVLDAETACHIYVLPEDAAADFFCHKQLDAL